MLARRRGSYATLSRDAAANAWPDFVSAVQAGVTSDDPFGRLPVQPPQIAQPGPSTIELAAKIFQRHTYRSGGGPPGSPNRCNCAREDERGIDREAIWRVGLLYDHVRSIGAARQTLGLSRRRPHR